MVSSSRAWISGSSSSSSSTRAAPASALGGWPDGVEPSIRAASSLTGSSLGARRGSERGTLAAKVRVVSETRGTFVPGRSFSRWSQRQRRGESRKTPATTPNTAKTDNYTRWIEFATGTVLAEEFYDHQAEPFEKTNRIEEAAHAEAVARLRKQLDKRVGHLP